MEERKMILYKDAVRYIEYQYKNESEIEDMIFEHSKNIFGKDSLLLVKRKINTNSGLGTIPDAFVISLDAKRWYLIEVELKNHPLYEHIVPQISKFNTAIKNSDSQKKLIKMIYEEIKDDPQKNLIFQLKQIKEVFKYITEILESKPQIIILIDGKNDELEEVCDSLPFDSKVIEFKTYIRENVGLGVHIHSFEPLENFKKIKPESNENKINDLTETEKKRIDFWKGLLEKSKKRTSLHSNISPSINSWIGTGSGKRGLGFNYVVTYKHGQIELYIDRVKDSQDENKKIFDELQSHMDEIEKEFGNKLKWERLDDKRASRISKRFDYAGLNDEEKWDKLQDNMVDGIIRLEKSLKKHIKNLKI